MKQNTRQLVLAGLFAALTAVGAFIKIPLGAMSLTLQFLFTALAGSLLGPVWGPVSQGVYVALGLLGIPIFTQGGGLGYLLQPSFGFLLGLIPTAAVIGLLSRQSSTWPRIALSCLAGLGILYAVGLPYMALILNLYMDKSLGFWNIIQSGMLIYLPGDFLKIAVAAALVPPVRRALSHR